MTLEEFEQLIGKFSIRPWREVKKYAVENYDEEIPYLIRDPGIGWYASDLKKPADLSVEMGEIYFSVIQKFYGHDILKPNVKLESIKQEYRIRQQDAMKLYAP